MSEQIEDKPEGCKSIAQATIDVLAPLANPKTGMLRGLFAESHDPDSKLIRISCGELRRYQAAVVRACLLLAPLLDDEE